MKNITQHLQKIFFTAILILFVTTVFAQDAEVFIQLGHSSHVKSVAYSPDGRYILSGDEDGILILWDVNSGREVKRMKGHTSTISNISFTPNGKKAVSASIDSTLRVWDISTGTQLHRFPGIITGGITSLDISPGGEFMITGHLDGTLTRWNLQDWTVQSYEGHKERINNVVISPDGSFVASGSTGNTIKLWSTETGKNIRIFSGHTSSIQSIAFSPDGQYLLSGAELTWQENSDNQQLVTKNPEQALKLWDVNTGEDLYSLKGHNFTGGWGFIKVTFSPDGKYMLASKDEEIKIWQLNSGSLERIIKVPNKSSYSSSNDRISMSFSSNSKYLITGGPDGVIRRWNFATGEKIDTYSGYRSSVNTVAAIPQKDQIFSGGEDQPLVLWDITNGSIVGSVIKDTLSIHSAVISPDSRYLLKKTNSNSDTVEVFNFATGRQVYNLAHPEVRLERDDYWRESLISDMSVSPDGHYALTAGDLGNIIIWDLQTGEEFRRFLHPVPNDPWGKVKVVFTPNSRFVISSGELGLRMWEIASGSEILHGGPNISAIDISPDGKYLLEGLQSGKLRLLNLNTVEVELELTGHKKKIKSVDYSPNGKFAVSLSSDGVIKRWDLLKGKEVTPFADLYGFDFSGHDGRITGITFSSDGKKIITSSEDGTTRIWSSMTGEELVKMVYYDDEWITITPEGYYTSSENGGNYLNVRIANKVYPIDNFFDIYYRPDIVQAKLAGKDISSLVDTKIQQTLALPPKVSIVNPEKGRKVSTGQATVKIKVTDQGGGIDEVRLYHNGKLVQTTGRGLKLKQAESYTYQIPLVSGENILEATAYNDYRVEGNSDRVTIHYTGATATSDLYVLAVGLNEYKNNSLNLNYGRPDAEAFVNSLKKQSDGIFKSVNITTLYDGQATRTDVKAAFEDIISKAKPQDAFLFFYAGHGVMSESEGQQQGDFYMALHEATQLYGNNAGLRAHGISAAEMTELTRRIPARKQMIVLDACQSGGAVETFAMRGAAEQKAIIQLARSAGLVVMASTGTQQYATEFSALGHGVFTYALLNGLQGKADGGSQDGKITVKELEAFINDRVPALTEKHRGQSQYPNSYARGQDFPIGVVK